jgi:Domain of unknown function (DUF4440)
MKLDRFWSGLAIVCVVASPLAALVYRDAQAAAPRAEWRAPQAKKAVPKSKKTAPASPQAPPAAITPPAALPGEPAVPNPSPPPEALVAVIDQSQEVLDIDFAMASTIASQGPKIGYASTLSDVGVLYDANGASPTGEEAANSRFSTFPADVTFVRTPEKALAAGGSGSSWGTYTIKRADTVLSAGRYISVWRREAIGWKMVSELAAGKAPSAPAGSTGNGVLPKRPASLARPAASPVGVPLTVPGPVAASEPPQPTPTPK